MNGIKDLKPNPDDINEIGKIMGKIAHDLRNPLGVINIAAYNLKKLVGEQEETALKRISAITQKTAEVNRIITDTLGYYRPEPPNLTEIDINALVEKAISSVEKEIPEGIETHKKLEDCPVVIADECQMVKTLQAIIKNAYESIEDKGRIAVTTRYDKGSEAVKISVSDTGCGISGDNMTRLGEPFFSTKGGRTGLSLALAFLSIKKNHKGEISVNSQDGNGTEIVITLPAGGK